MNADYTTDFREFVLRVLFGPATVLVFCLLFVPFVLGVFDTRLMTPLAAPGYGLMIAMTIVGSHVVPQYDLWVYWAPFVAACYAIAVTLGGIYYGIRAAK